MRPVICQQLIYPFTHQTKKYHRSSRGNMMLLYSVLRIFNTVKVTMILEDGGPRKR